MAIRPFLAMTAAEIQSIQSFPERIGWMACHFSPYGNGISNLPRELPPGSLLILNDRIPIHGHDPEVIAGQLRQCFDGCQCHGLLLDLQRPDCPETARLVRHLSGELSCTVAVSEWYAQESSGPVLLPPLPHHIPLAEYITPWKSRDIWLEIALDEEIITLTEKGCAVTSLPSFHLPEHGFAEENLHCHYHIKFTENRADFTLWRTKEDLKALLCEASNHGISTAVGLYQELYP